MVIDGCFDLICIALLILLVPIIEPISNSFNFLSLILLMKTSYGFSLFGTLAIISFSENPACKSLRLCTAKSALYCNNESFTSFSKTPF
jgi:hypothetical protein